MAQPPGGPRAEERAEGFHGRFKARVLDPTVLAGPPTAAALCVLRLVGLTAAIPYWSIVLLVLFAQLASITSAALWSESPQGWRLYAYVGIVMGVIASVAYSTGWGPILSLGFIFGAAYTLQISGSAAAKPAMVFSILYMGLGQLAIELNFAPSLIRQPLVHGLAGLSLLGVLLTTMLLSRSIADRQTAEAELTHSERRFKALVHNAADIIVVTDASGVMQYVSPAFDRILGFSPQQFFTRPASELLHIDDLARLRSGGSFDHGWQTELRLQTSSGGWRLFEATVTDHLNDPDVRGIVANLHDITNRKLLEEELRHQAFHDSLTGLANRALFTDRVEHALARQGRTGDALSVLLVDLDDFKAINDSLGHEVGDRMLAAVATKLGRIVRASDTVARLGGDEFAVLLEDPAKNDGPEQVAERIVKTFGDPIDLEDRSFVVSVSVGVAMSSARTSSADELVRNADMAMYSAKARGKGRWARFERPMQVAVQKRLEVKTGLLEAIAEGDQMELYYQPVVNLESREVTAVEALLRWNHPDRGIEAPLEFLPVAEESGLIVELGRWVLEEAVNQLATWRRRHPSLARLAMSVNVSGRQLEDPRFVNDVRDALKKSEVNPSLLVLEMTESILMHETRDTIARFSKLKRVGVRLAIDDFGTGYSSLGYLQHFPIDILKVDRNFIADVGDPSRRGALAEAVVGMGAILDLQTVAEGVELDSQARRLQALGCVFGQGFLFSPPLRARECETFLCEMAELHGAPGLHAIESPLVDARMDACRGTLTFHKDSSVECSDDTCVASRSPDKALGIHSLVVTCHSQQCLSCADRVICDRVPARVDVSEAQPDT